MAKVLLVEDDNNLREIYEARLQAEGYETVTASDGEMALAVAKDAKPDLVISDVMMPKISGFEMLDILRNTDGLKDVKVIMLTALGQAEDKTRADQLGANKYLVKSQVTLEDIVKTAHQLLDDEPAPAAAPTAVEAVPVAATMPTTTPAVTTPAPEPAVASSPPVNGTPASVTEPVVTPGVPEPIAPPEPAATSSPANSAVPDTSTPEAEVAAPVAEKAATSTAEEQAAMQAQIDNFVQEAVAAEPVAATSSIITPVEPVSAPEPQAVVSESQTPVSPVPTEADNTASHDEVMADAMDSLNEAVEPHEKPSDVTAVEVAPDPDHASSAQAPDPAKDTPPAAPNTPVSTSGTTPDNDGVTIAHKKIIQPISGPEAKPDINELLAKETAAEQADKPIAPPPASTTIAPVPGDIDPNSVAL